MRRIFFGLGVAGTLTAIVALADRSYIMPSTAREAGIVVHVRVDPCPSQVATDGGSVCAPADFQIVGQVRAATDGGATDDFRCVYHVPLTNAALQTLISTTYSTCAAAYE